ncbi:MAG: M48 family metallopeptidase [Candidatus Heimdallarchaeota archaeon]|nr:M48 family metallopeptidase [Candidatus Heimdallarchaeota archaeon]
MTNKLEIVRSRNRKKTISARIVGDTMIVNAPFRVSEAELNKAIDSFKSRFKKSLLKKKLNQTQDLKIVAERINKEYFKGRLNIESIKYSTNQKRIFGSCNYKTKRIHISHKLAEVPGWVRDYVIMHELAHLIEPNHSKLFWDIVFRYKLAERARGYLIAVGLGENVREPDTKII